MAIVGVLAGLAAVFTLGPKAAPGDRVVKVRVGEETLVVSSALLGPAVQEGRDEVGLLRLRLTWPALQAVDIKGVEETGAPPVVHVTVAPADPAFDPALQLKTWSRFLTPTAWSNPGGLVARSFRKDTPFATDELYVAASDRRGFAALCPVQTQPLRFEEPCRATLRHGPFDIALRFPREALTEWQALSDGARAVVDRLRRAP